MSEEISFDPTGTVTVTFDDQTYKLSRPKLRQWRYFHRRIDEMTSKAKETLNVLSADVALTANALDEDKSDENIEAAQLAAQRLSEFASKPFYETSSELIREMFVQLGSSPLPDDLDDWPVWLAANVSLPMQLLNHWQTVPKASGSQNGS